MTGTLYQYAVINEHSGERLYYAHTEVEAKKFVEDNAIRHGSQRLSVWSRQATFENVRSWK